MMKDKYSKAYKEVLEIIKLFPEEEYRKIPKEKIEFYKNNMDNEYELVIYPMKKLSEQNISKEANSIIVSLYQDYFATQEEKQKIKEILELNYEKKKREERALDDKVGAEDLFGNNHKQYNIQKEKIKETVPIVPNNDSFFKRFVNKLKKIFKIN